MSSDMSEVRQRVFTRKLKKRLQIIEEGNLKTNQSHRFQESENNDSHCPDAFHQFE